MLESLEDRVVPANTWTVNALTDNGVGNGLFGDLRYCVNNVASGDTINFNQAGAGGTIQLKSELMLGAGPNGLPNNVTNVTIDGGANNIAISGQNVTRLFEISAGNDTISNLILANGQVTGSYGGAILVDNGAVLNLSKDSFNNNVAQTNGALGGNGGAIENVGTLQDSGSTYTGNSASGNGGAIESHSGGAGKLTVNNSSFFGNNAVSGGAIDTSDNTTLSNDTFGGVQANQGNNAAGGGGGALNTTVSATLTSDQFIGNSSRFDATGAGGNGGAIQNSGGIGIDNSTFKNNQSDAAGGAIENDGAASTGTLTKFTNNTAGTNGGAIDSNSGNPNGKLNVLDTIFSGNTAQVGGAINTADNTTLDGDGFGVDLQLIPNVLPPNIATNGGGAVSTAEGASPTMTLSVSASNFTGNRVSAPGGFGGAIDTTVVTDVETSIFTLNQAAEGGAIDYAVNNDTMTSFTSSLIVNLDTFNNNSPPITIAGSGGGAIRSFVDIASGTVAVSLTNRSCKTTN